MRKTIISIALFLGLATLSYGQTGFNGTWVTTDFGSPEVMSSWNYLEFKVDGTKVTGTIGALPIDDGVISADTITFKATNTNPANPTLARINSFTGKLNGDTIAFTRSVKLSDEKAAGGMGMFGTLSPMQFAAKRAVEGAALTAPSLGLLQANILQITKSVDTNWGIYIKCLDSGEEIAINADRVMDTMSVIKLPLMVEAFRQIEAGKFSLNDRYTFKMEDSRPGTGVIRSLDEGAVLTVKDLLTLMTIVSDNTATDAIFAKVEGPATVNQLMQSYGLNTIKAVGNADAWFKKIAAVGSSVVFHGDGINPFGLSSPRDMGKLLEKIGKREAVSKKASDQMIQILTGQIYRTRLPKYVSAFQIAHKTGDFVPWVANDVGLFISPKHTVVVSVFTEKHDIPVGMPTGLIGAQIEDAIGRIGEQVANYFGYK